jgi:hypothetical protein
MAGKDGSALKPPFESGVAVWVNFTKIKMKNGSSRQQRKLEYELNWLRGVWLAHENEMDPSIMFSMLLCVQMRIYMYPTECFACVHLKGSEFSFHGWSINKLYHSAACLVDSI